MSVELHDFMREIPLLAQRARVASRQLSLCSTEQRDQVLARLAERLEAVPEALLEANARDLAVAEAKGVRGALLDRLRLTPERVKALAQSVREIQALQDPTGETVTGWRRPDGIEIREVRVPLGVVCVIYESRPNVTIDVAALCLKSGNAVLLKGGSDALQTNRELSAMIQASLEQAAVPVESVQLINTSSREAVYALLQQDRWIDVVIPRGGESLIREVVAHSRIPVIKQYKGVCHIYVAPDADLDASIPLILNAKCQRPGTCNALETLLVDEAIAAEFLPRVGAQLLERGVRLRGCEHTCRLLSQAEPATPEDWDEEYLDLILSIRVVPSLELAIEHIHRHGTGHSEAILTQSLTRARQFQRQVDAACVYVNASTRLTDGGQFGFGAEVGISTDKLHARGPMGLRDLTTRKYWIDGEYTLRR